MNGYFVITGGDRPLALFSELESAVNMFKEMQLISTYLAQYSEVANAALSCELFNGVLNLTDSERECHTAKLNLDAIWGCKMFI